MSDKTFYPNMFDIVRDGDQVTLHIPEGIRGHMAMLVAQALGRLDDLSTPNLPKRDIEKTGDFLEDLETEMANDAVAESVEAQVSLQAMVAERVLQPLAQLKREPITLDAEEAVDLACWLNNQRHRLNDDTFVEISRDPVKLSETINVLCSVTSLELLKAAA